MSDETRFAVLVSTDGGLLWKRHAGIIASNGEQACKRVRDMHYNSGGKDADALFYATQAFRPRKMVPRAVTKLTMQQVDLPDGSDITVPKDPNIEIPVSVPHQPQPGDSSVAPGEFES